MLNPKIIITERPDSKPSERYFDGYLDVCRNIVSQSYVIAASSSATIAWATKCENELANRGYQSERVYTNF